MLILGIDTSTKICTCSIFDSENGVIAETSLSVKKNHSNIVMPIIDNLFKISDLNINDIDKIAVAIGPGSFTGVRIALGIAKGLAMALNKPLIAVNELDILEAIASGNENEIIPLIDARKERVYYKYQNTYIDDYLINLISNFDKNKKYVFVGDGAINYKNILKDNLGENAIVLPMYNAFPRASVLCKLALNKEEANIYTLEPEYISKSRAEKNF
ncbi:tRNA (adenosine(37)-N6)-threonylcarbamoyltransferase complex dimerization subunit type 1 TsaB [Fusobacterium polymorphum]|uniref:tRNA (Adenosine(37)-N6)-threonylcarbamoyltransferase complex dimerization subunit type 1 TsaB n=1 Tax=Fusobacterium nucleatum subsp. polymorphum TaxID=76857 RepID=A0A2C6CBW5_FUSNP|nr:tRNA (adenosine(37)-N6)-threonylcarbamoyltransferase complex dimerization subunit type 1 TsaB [Fusobacterium polymorphum]PHI13884.1 tRNA (adenosine(37)-N6)-threonylcarbamoyltransferase complex dimerization subunit type 1 TsaB [Fusobacterium polymorphum]